jgi:hypothetical protein
MVIRKRRNVATRKVRTILLSGRLGRVYNARLLLNPSALLRWAAEFIRKAGWRFPLWSTTAVRECDRIELTEDT